MKRIAATFIATIFSAALFNSTPVLANGDQESMQQNAYYELLQKQQMLAWEAEKAQTDNHETNRDEKDDEVFVILSCENYPECDEQEK